MSTLLLTSQLLNENYVSGDGSYSSYQVGLVATGGSSTAVSYTTATGIVLNRPFLKANLYNSTYVPHPGKFLAGGAAGVTKLIVFSGDRPDIASISDLAEFDSQKLISFSIPAWSSSRANTGLFVESVAPATYSGFKAICGICPTLTTATGTGIATWFWFGICLTDAEAKVYNASYSGNYNNLSGYQFVTGSVGLLSSGSDLEIADRNIISGQQYKSFGFNFYIPSVNEIVE
jgi:hypothetical protein